MNTTEGQSYQWGPYLSPFKVTLLALNAACLGVCTVLWAVGDGDGPLVLLTIGSGLTLSAGWVGIVVTSCRRGKRGSGSAAQQATLAVSPILLSGGRAMKMFARIALFSIGLLLLLYVFSIGEIWNNHSPGNYLLLCTGIVSFALGLLAVAINSRRT